MMGTQLTCIVCGFVGLATGTTNSYSALEINADIKIVYL
jgi:hypothetical protein